MTSGDPETFDEENLNTYSEDFEEGEWSEDVEPEGAEALWEQKQRELLTSVLDYSLGSLSNLVATKQIDLSPRYQRRDRWRPERQSKLIESFLMNVPVPPIFLNEDDFGKYSVIDGKQRLTAIHEFMRGRLKLKGLKVFSELNGCSIDELSPALKSVLEMRSNLRATIILHQSDRDVKFEVFRRLNTGGVSLNPQEIRNSTWPGPLNDLLLDLSEDSRTRRMLRISRPQASALWKEMRDVELILRFFTFKDDWDTFSGGMAKRLDLYMSSKQRPGDVFLQGNRREFMSALSVCEAAFGEFAFRRYQPERSAWRTPILASLYDAQMFAAQSFTEEEVKGHRETLLAGYKDLFDDTDFRKSIDAATNTPALFRARIEAVQALFNRTIQQ